MLAARCSKRRAFLMLDGIPTVAAACNHDSIGLLPLPECPNLLSPWRWQARMVKRSAADGLCFEMNCAEEVKSLGARTRWLVAAVCSLACFVACWVGLALAHVGGTVVQVGVASVPLVVILAAQGMQARRTAGKAARAKRAAAPKRSPLFGESGRIIASVLVRSPNNLPKMPSGKLRELAENFVNEFDRHTTDPAYTLETWEEMFILWLHEEPDSPPSNVERHMRYDGLHRGVHADRLPEGPPPKGSRSYLQKATRGYVQPEAAEVANPRPGAAEVINIQPEAAEVINKDEQLRIEWSTVNGDIKRIYEILGPPPLKTPLGVLVGR